ncbi:hypothetical protein INR49_000661 [Caranx melampygus]|nr:hypothetical protein INR49_000661 [Caranx melampygus]
MCSAATVLQAAYRGRQVRKEVVRQHQAATVIQSVFRKHREEVKFQAMRLSTIIIQRYYRAHLLQRSNRENFLKLSEVIVFGETWPTCTEQLLSFKQTSRGTSSSRLSRDNAGQLVSYSRGSELRDRETFS